MANKIAALFVAFAIWLGSALAMAQKAASYNLQLTISTKNSEIPNGVDLPVITTYTNLTNRSIAVPMGQQNGRDVVDVFEVTDPIGSRIEPISEISDPSKTIHWGQMTLSPKESRVRPSVLYSSEYRFDKTGIYKIRLCRKSPDSGVSINCSNTITVHIVDWDVYMNQDQRRGSSGELLKPTLKITITPNTPEIATGQDVSLTATYTNLTDHDLSTPGIETGAVDTVNILDVHDPQGRVVVPHLGPHPELGQSFPRPGGLLPNQSVTHEIVISNKLYPFVYPGSYTIRICRGRYQTNSQTVCSNIVNVKVLPVVSSNAHMN